MAGCLQRVSLSPFPQSQWPNNEPGYKKRGRSDQSGQERDEQLAVCNCIKKTGARLWLLLYLQPPFPPQANAGAKSLAQEEKNMLKSQNEQNNWLCAIPRSDVSPRESIPLPLHDHHKYDRPGPASDNP